MSNVTNNTGAALAASTYVLVRSLNKMFPGKDIVIDNIDGELSVHIVNQGKLPIGAAGVEFDGFGIVLRYIGVPADETPEMEMIVERSEAYKPNTASAAKRTAWFVLGAAAIAAAGVYAYGRYARTAASE